MLEFVDVGKHEQDVDWADGPRIAKHARWQALARAALHLAAQVLRAHTAGPRGATTRTELLFSKRTKHGPTLRTIERSQRGRVQPSYNGG